MHIQWKMHDLMDLFQFSKSKKEQLSVLINREDGITPFECNTVESKNFKYKAIKAEVNKALGLAELYDFAKSFLPSLKICKNSIRYYADLAEQYAASRLRRLVSHNNGFKLCSFVISSLSTNWIT
ncbi:hypothetical protein PGH45_19405 [Legionella pneumophila]|nr:hypothetical protein [Legionella pneumophila]